MKNQVVNFIQGVFMRFGVQVTKKKRGVEYMNLLNKARYTPMKIKLLGKDFRIADAPSFYYSYHEIFTEKIYHFNTNSKQPLILDCGSNYGTSIAYFKEIYPNAKVIGFEPDPKIFSILKENIETRGLKDVELLNYGLWKEETTLTFESEGADGGRISDDTDSSNSIGIKTKKLSDYLKDTKVDMLKMDIEGAEIQVLKEAQDYLANAENIFIEFHSFQNEPQGLADLLAILEQQGFRYYIHTQFCSQTPFTEIQLQLGMDLQLNIFAVK
jgi:FkbM family methyltransferase